VVLQGDPSLTPRRTLVTAWTPLSRDQWRAPVVLDPSPRHHARAICT